MRVAHWILIHTTVAMFITSAAVAGPTPPPTNVLFGFVSADRTLTLAPPGPFYYLPGDLVIRPGVTLTIEPGVRLAASPSDTLVGGTDPSRVEITVQGTLLAAGTPADSVRFESAAGGTAEWWGIRSEGAGSIDLGHAAVRGTFTAINCDGSGPHHLRNLGISATINGITTGLSSCDVRDCRISGRGGAFGFTGIGLFVGPNAVTTFPDSLDARPTVITGFNNGAQVAPFGTARNLVVYGNGNGISASTQSVVNYCTAVANQTGIVCNGSLLLNSIIASNAPVGTLVFGSFFDYCDVWSNGTNFQGSPPGDHSASFNPFFTNSAANDYRLSSGSIFRHWSNSGGEIGAYGPGPGLPVAAKRTSWSQLKGLYR